MQKPLALVVVGGILLAPVLILLVLPVLIDLFSRRRAWVEDEEAGETALVDGATQTGAETGEG